MTWIERQLVKLGARKVRSMDGFKKYGPLVAGAYLVLLVGLRVAGQDDAAKAVESIGNLVGAANGSPVSYSELMAAATLLFGIGRKVKSEVDRAKDKDEYVVPIR